MSTNAQNELARQVVWADDATPFSGAQVRDLLAENDRLRAERDAYYRTATERHLELARLRAVADGLAEACREALEALVTVNTEDMTRFERGFNEEIGEIEDALATYDAAAGPGKAVDHAQ